MFIQMLAKALIQSVYHVNLLCYELTSARLPVSCLTQLLVFKTESVIQYLTSPESALQFPPDLLFRNANSVSAKCSAQPVYSTLQSWAQGRGLGELQLHLG
ncbi:unnamed protein product [Pleuronectes platessa]|uniref:Uncharacterized protein n=1 Tax=Pleuronectes platessa TaxID=8262 RepID=A0A9N7Y761_PLEPL|nr:unnamed protein product [Pleuronectes platessa]